VAISGIASVFKSGRAANYYFVRRKRAAAVVTLRARGETVERTSTAYGCLWEGKAVVSWNVMGKRRLCGVFPDLKMSMAASVIGTRRKARAPDERVTCFQPSAVLPTPPLRIPRGADLYSVMVLAVRKWAAMPQKRCYLSTYGHSVRPRWDPCVDSAVVFMFDNMRLFFLLLGSIVSHSRIGSGVHGTNSQSKSP